MILSAEQQRWRLALVLMVTFFVAYMDRLNISFAVPLMAAEYGWSEADTQSYGSLLMGIFYGAYGLGNLLLTPYAARLGPRRCLLLIVVLWSVFTAMGAWLSQWLIALMATRVLLGFSEAVHVPMVSQLFKLWFPVQERARANSIFVSGLFLAVLLSPLLLVPLMDSLGWRWGFVVIALAGLLLSLPLVVLFVRDTPAESPGITAEERAYIASGLEQAATEEQGGDIWRSLVLTKPFLLVLVVGIINNVVALGVSSWLPTYFTTARGVDFKDITWLVATPYLFSLLGIALWSNLGDRYNVRAGIGAFGCAGAGVLLYFALTAESMPVVLACFSLAVFMVSAFNACEFALLQRIAPLEHAAHGMGIYNGIATMIGGGLGPLIVSPIISADGPAWGISLIAFANACLLLWVYRLVRY